MKFEAALDPAKYRQDRATRRANTRKNHGPFHRNMTAWRPRCVMCAQKPKDTKIPSYRTLCYQCEITVLMSRIAKASLAAKKAVGVNG